MAERRPDKSRPGGVHFAVEWDSYVLREVEVHCPRRGCRDGTAPQDTLLHYHLAHHRFWIQHREPQKARLRYDTRFAQDAELDIRAGHDGGVSSDMAEEESAPWPNRHSIANCTPLHNGGGVDIATAAYPIQLAKYSPLVERTGTDDSPDKAEYAEPFRSGADLNSPGNLVTPQNMAPMV